MSKKSLQPAIAVRDYDNRWYIIPEHLEPKWDSMIHILNETNISSEEWFELTNIFLKMFMKYATGSDMNSRQLYAEFKSIKEEEDE